MSYADEHIRAKIADIENRLKQKEADLLNRINHPKVNTGVAYTSAISYVTGMAYPHYYDGTVHIYNNTMGYHNQKL